MIDSGLRGTMIRLLPFAVLISLLCPSASAQCCTSIEGPSTSQHVASNGTPSVRSKEFAALVSELDRYFNTPCNQVQPSYFDFVELFARRTIRYARTDRAMRRAGTRLTIRDLANYQREQSEEQQFLEKAGKIEFLHRSTFWNDAETFTRKLFVGGLNVGGSREAILVGDGSPEEQESMARDAVRELHRVRPIASNFKPIYKGCVMPDGSRREVTTHSAAASQQVEPSSSSASKQFSMSEAKARIAFAELLHDRTQGDVNWGVAGIARDILVGDMSGAETHDETIEMMKPNSPLWQELSQKSFHILVFRSLSGESRAALITAQGPKDVNFSSIDRAEINAAIADLRRR